MNNRRRHKIKENGRRATKRQRKKAMCVLFLRVKKGFAIFLLATVNERARGRGPLKLKEVGYF